MNDCKGTIHRGSQQGSSTTWNVHVKDAPLASKSSTATSEGVANRGNCQTIPSDVASKLKRDVAETREKSTCRPHCNDNVDGFEAELAVGEPAAFHSFSQIIQMRFIHTYIHMLTASGLGISSLLLLKL